MRDTLKTQEELLEEARAEIKREDKVMFALWLIIIASLATGLSIFYLFAPPGWINDHHSAIFLLVFGVTSAILGWVARVWE